MKTLTIYNEEFTAEKIYKNDDSIIGKDINGNILFSFKGINDMSLFSLNDEQSFDIESNIEDKLILDSINMQMQIDALIKSTLGGQ